MNKKVGKIFALSIIALFLISFLIGSVSAADASQSLKPLVDMVSGLVSNIYGALKPALALLVGSNDTAPEFLGKVLIAILLFSVTYAVLSTSNLFGNKFKWALSLSSLVISLLGVRYLTPEWVSMAALPSAAYAVALTALIPFIAFGFIIMKFRSKTARKLSWILFGVAFLILWVSRDDLGTTAATIYPLAAALCLVMIMLDGTIKQWQNKVAAEKAMSVKNYQKYIQLLKDRDEKYDLYVDAVRRFGANHASAKILKTDLDSIDQAILTLLP